MDMNETKHSLGFEQYQPHMMEIEEDFVKSEILSHLKQCLEILRTYEDELDRCDLNYKERLWHCHVVENSNNTIDIIRKIENL